MKVESCLTKSVRTDMYSPGLAARRAAQEAQWQEQQHESATDADSGLWHAGFDALTSRVSRGLFGGESLSDNGVHKVGADFHRLQTLDQLTMALTLLHRW